MENANIRKSKSQRPQRPKGSAQRPFTQSKLLRSKNRGGARPDPTSTYYATQTGVAAVN